MNGAAKLGKRILAYAVDAGSFSWINRLLVRRVASRTNLIVTRNQSATGRLAVYGARAPIEATADNAFTHTTWPEDAGWPQREWPRARDGMVGLAVVDYHLFPVVMRPLGRKEDCYKWPYCFSRSAQRRKACRELAAGYARLADRIVEEHGAPVALICMEEVDERLASAVRDRMKHRDMVRIFSSRCYNASQMTVLLRSLRLLVTSRYHAAVLSLGAKVPQIAVGRDLRLRTLYEDLGIRERFFIDPHTPWIFEWLKERIDQLLNDPGLVCRALEAGHADQLGRARGSSALLAREMESIVKSGGLS